ncbi:MAG: hypothetical protein AB1720_09855 [Pseudomonadota bacterium]
MSVKAILRATGAIGLGALLLAGAAGAAGMAVGKVTAVDPARNTIGINGITFELTDASRRELLVRINEVKPGTAVSFEANGKQVTRILPVQGGTDFPLLPPPGPGARPVMPVR